MRRGSDEPFTDKKIEWNQQFQDSARYGGTMELMAAAARRLLVFSDLDGTLLDKETYSWEPARKAVQLLHECGAALILASSKTLSEMGDLHQSLCPRSPFVFENGAGAALPTNGFSCADYDIERAGFRIKLFGADRSRVLEVLRKRRSQGFRFEGFADWSAQEIATATGLDLESANRAADRLATEPLLWRDTDERRKVFAQTLEKDGLTLVQGGRFWAAMGRFDKAEAVRWIQELYETESPEADFLSIALGDSPNDERMLAEADIAVLVRSENSNLVRLSNHRRVYRTREAGPLGWQEAITTLVSDLGTR